MPPYDSTPPSHAPGAWTGVNSLAVATRTVYDAVVENFADDVVRLEGDVHVWRQMVSEALAQLHHAHRREQYQQRRLAALVDEVRRLRARGAA